MLQADKLSVAKTLGSRKLACGLNSRAMQDVINAGPGSPRGWQCPGLAFLKRSVLQSPIPWLRQHQTVKPCLTSEASSGSNLSIKARDCPRPTVLNRRNTTSNSVAATIHIFLLSEHRL